jgi:hypothetical protein
MSAEVVEISKVAWRRRFTAEEQDAIDAFNDGGYLTHPALDSATKGKIRRGLVLYAETVNVNPLDPDTRELLGLYEMLGLLAPGRADEIVGAQPAVPAEVPASSVGVYLLANQITVIAEGEDPPDEYIKYWPLTPAVAALVDAGGAQLRVVGDGIEIVSALS